MGAEKVRQNQLTTAIYKHTTHSIHLMFYMNLNYKCIDIYMYIVVVVVVVVIIVAFTCGMN